MRRILTVLGALSALGVTGCATHPTNEDLGTGIGAAAGALLGKTIGEREDQRSR